MHQDKAQAVHGTPTENGTAVPTLEVGTRVYVRDRYLGQWNGGFEVAALVESGYRLRRLSDGHAFPDVFRSEDVRLDRRQSPLRGISGSYLDRRH